MKKSYLLKCFLLFILFYILILTNINAQNTQNTWQKTFGGKNNERAFSIQQTKDGGYIVVGYTDSFGAGNRDFYIIKLDNNGNKIWDKTFGGKDKDWAFSIQQTNDGDHIIAGFTSSFGAGGEDFYILKLDSSGNARPYSTTKY